MPDVNKPPSTNKQTITKHSFYCQSKWAVAKGNDL